MKTNKMHKTIKAALIAAGALSCFPVAQADVLATYNFTGTTGLEASASASFSADFVTVSDITRGTNFGAPGSSSDFTSNGMAFAPGLAMGNALFRANYTIGTAVEYDAYFEFSLTVDAGYELDVASITFGARRASNNTGPNNLAIRSSLDGFASNLASQAIAGTAADPTGVVFNLGETVQSVTGTIIFRIYGYGRNASNASYGLLTIGNDSSAPFTINGSVTSAIPEPGTIALGLGAVAVGVAAIRRRHR
ncbi:hypothetical protein OPIT5_23720 [Opitutaceae bacterium TAV5]|nr:hypothetical protein OPIT5_23720 [Opitutaceae bacterium TAV5]